MADKPEYGSFLNWHAISKHTEHLHNISIDHLIEIWPSLRSRAGDASLWGDEVEYQVVRLDHDAREAHLVPRQDAILDTLQNGEANSDDDGKGEYQPEYTKYMVESSPSRPYTSHVSSLLSVEANLAARRDAIAGASGKDACPFTLSLFPRLGVPELAEILPVVENPAPETVFKAAVASVGRHRTLRENLNVRSGRRYEADVPLFIDTNTRSVLDRLEATGDVVQNGKADAPCIHLDDLVFAMGGCGLQATFQSNTLSDVRMLHDQLCILGPILLALTASTPIYKSMLADTDARWNQACSMVDDRRPNEMAHLSTRWSCSPAYISDSARVRAGYQHRELTRDEATQARLEAAGFDPTMAQYFANLHQRDPLVLFARGARVPDAMSAEEVHQSICGSVWSHVRLKLPPSEESTDPSAPPEGWRVEFRPMEVQLTDFANAAFLVFMQLLRRALAAFDRDLYMPLPLVEANMDRAHQRGAVVTQKFWFPRTLQPEQRVVGDVVLQSVDEIVNGSKDAFEGLIPLVRRYVRSEEVSLNNAKALAKFDEYLDHIGARAVGREKTPAQWQRDFVQNHPDYAGDSILTARINYDMMCEIKRMNQG